MRCRGVQRLAKPLYLGGFLCSGLQAVAPYCVSSGIRVVSIPSSQPSPTKSALVSVLRLSSQCLRGPGIILVVMQVCGIYSLTAVPEALTMSMLPP